MISSFFTPPPFSTPAAHTPCAGDELPPAGLARGLENDGGPGLGVGRKRRPPLTHSVSQRKRNAV